MDAADRILERYAKLYGNSGPAEARDEYRVATRVKELEAELATLQKARGWRYGSEGPPEVGRWAVMWWWIPHVDGTGEWQGTVDKMAGDKRDLEGIDVWRYIDPPPDDVLARLRKKAGT